MTERDHLHVVSRVCDGIVRYAEPDGEGVVDLSDAMALGFLASDAFRRGNFEVVRELPISPALRPAFGLELDRLCTEGSRFASVAGLFRDALEVGEVRLVDGLSVSSELAIVDAVEWFVPDSGLRDVVGDTVRRWVFIISEAFMFISDGISSDRLSDSQLALMGCMGRATSWGWQTLRKPGAVEFVAPPVVIRNVPDGMLFVFDQSLLPILRRCLAELMRPDRSLHRSARVGDIEVFLDTHMDF